MHKTTKTLSLSARKETIGGFNHTRTRQFGSSARIAQSQGTVRGTTFTDLNKSLNESAKATVTPNYWADERPKAFGGLGEGDLRENPISIVKKNSEAVDFATVIVLRNILDVVQPKRWRLEAHSDQPKRSE